MMMSIVDYMSGLWSKKIFFYMGLDTLYEKFVKVTLWYLNTEELVPR